MKLSQRLFERGAGWLRWGMVEEVQHSWYDPPEPYVYAPPLRRLWIYLAQWPRSVWWWLVGGPIGPGWLEDEVLGGEKVHRQRLSWEEVRPCWPDLTDPERRKR